MIRLLRLSRILPLVGLMFALVANATLPTDPCYPSYETWMVSGAEAYKCTRRGKWSSVGSIGFQPINVSLSLRLDQARLISSVMLMKDGNPHLGRPDIISPRLKMLPPNEWPNAPELNQDGLAFSFSAQPSLRNYGEVELDIIMEIDKGTVRGRIPVPTLEHGVTIGRLETRVVLSRDVPISLPLMANGKQYLVKLVWPAVANFDADPLPSQRSDGIECMDKTKVDSNISPVELWKSIGQCINTERYEAGVYLYAVAGAYGRFDGMRVADKTAQQATKILPMATFGMFSGEKVEAFQNHIKRTLGDDRIRIALCAEIAALPPPSYVPTYMLNHGMAAFTSDSQASPYAVPFNPNEAWPIAVRDYLLCAKE